jgi:hypothetical protein
MRIGKISMMRWQNNLMQCGVRNEVGGPTGHSFLLPNVW